MEIVTIRGRSKYHAKNHPAMPSVAAKSAVNSNWRFKNKRKVRCSMIFWSIFQNE